MEEILEVIHLDGERRAVLGSYALWKSRKNPYNWRPIDCDVFIYTKNINIFREIVNELVIKISQFGYQTKQISDKYRVLDFKIEGIREILSFVWTDKKLDDVSYYFDITCCMYKYFYDKGESKYIVSTTPEVEYFTKQGIAIVYKDTSKLRIRKYRDRGFHIISVNVSKPI